MKKLFLVFAVALLCLFSTKDIAFCDTSAITSPEMKSPYDHPGYNDTYFTYYSNITGYKSNGLWGFYSKSNSSVNIPPMYTDIEGLNYNYIKVKRGGKWGLIDTQGYQILQTSYDDIETFSINSNDYFKIKLNGSYGIVDSYGNEKVPPIFQTISNLNNNYLKVSINNKYGVISSNDASVVVSISYDDVSTLDKYFKVKFGGKWGLIDKLQNSIVPANYDDIKILNNKYFAVKSNRVWGTFDKNSGEEVIKPTYDKIEVGKANYLKVKHNGKWGAATYEGKIVIPITKGPLEINKELKRIY